MSTTAASSLKLALTNFGCIFKIEGRGTLRESKALQTRAEEVLAAGDTRVVLDLSPCDYLDSTFLGGIAILHRHFGNSPEARFAVHGARAHCQTLFGPTHLDSVLPFVEHLPDTIGDYEEVMVTAETATSLGRHVMHSHKLLAEFDGPQRQSFASIADRLASELGDE